MTQPFATYSSPEVQEQVFQVNPSQDRYNTTNGITTGPSAYVLEAGQIDKDKPAEPKCNKDGEFTFLGKVRMQLTGLQDDINEYLTQQMEAAKNKKLKQDDELRIKNEIDKLLDGGDGDDSEDSSPENK
ncbi:LAME_0G03752g1_1 [Lachancea meyersii CBS 8951]|uniref:EKC/KEOPS complex subunit GON7 n=1 Tax=Lachancea meyersii CBS 8951 TaxID=1266667 RepID=A0A1G4K6S0_9SACH|nr:LAME_0G03752g1_1 [Lachancea meyersii CBS 8951]